MSDLKITLIQTALHWENVDENLRQFEYIFTPLKNTTDLIVIPEMFSTGFSMQPKKLAEEMNGKTMQWMRQQAKAANAVITGSMIIRENDRFFNRLIWMRPQGDFDYYDKRHLFTLGNEHQHYSAGEKRIIVTLNGWKICPLVCYDLRFPVWCRNRRQTTDNGPQKQPSPVDRGQWTVDEQFDLLLFVANWPERRNFAWKNLLQARAIENQCYVAAVNRIGNDGNGIYHSGDSALIDPMGEVIFTQADTTFTKTFSLSCERLNDVREKMPFFQDGDEFEINTK